MLFTKNHGFAMTKFIQVLIGVTFTLTIWARTIDSANILGIFSKILPSHVGFNEALMRTLHHAGHNITIICPQDMARYKPQENYTILPFELSPSNVTVAESVEKFASVTYEDYLRLAVPDLEITCKVIGKHAYFQDILRGTTKFDVLFVEYTSLYLCYTQTAEKFEKPVIFTSPVRYASYIDDTIGNPSHPAITPSGFHFLPMKMNFYQRLQNMWTHIHSSWVQWKFLRSAKYAIEEKVFADCNITSENSYSVVFQNGHPALLSRPSIPSVIEVGGIHLQPAKPVPQRIQKFMDQAEAGVILFTLGTMTKGTFLSPRLLAAFKNAFAEIPQRVIWKYKNVIEGLPGNVLTLDWVPQRDILAHKNIKAFITHCGINSVYEAIEEAVPLIMVPMNGDQLPNAASLQEREVGVHLNVMTLTEKDVVDSINKIIKESRYKENMEKLSKIFKDRPISPQKSVVYWTEYVIKHKGAEHLRTVLSDMPFYQYCFLDVISFILLVFVSLVLVVRFIRQIIRVIICVVKRMNS